MAEPAGALLPPPTTAPAPPAPVRRARVEPLRVWQPKSVALVHDYVNQPGGAERVVLAMAAMFPQAPLYTSLYRAGSSHAGFEDMDIRTSVLDRVPVDRAFRMLLPAYPMAFRSLGCLSEDLVISSSSGWAHSIRTRPESVHVVYCHTPARWLYMPDDYLGSSRRTRVLAPLLASLKRWDKQMATRPDAYIANSRLVQRRIRKVYGIDADVVYPPVDTDRFTPGPRGNRLLMISRLLPYKHAELAVEAAGRLGIGLDVAGDGPELEGLRAMAGPNVTFHGRVTDQEITDLLEGCSALCVPGAEDFGISTVEALACGKPVVAFAGGGAGEILDDGVNGCLFTVQTVDAVTQAIRRVESLYTDPQRLAARARNFSHSEFERNLAAAVQLVWARRADPAVAFAQAA